MNAPGELKEILKKDIDSSFKKLIEECSLREMNKTIQKAENQLYEELNHDIADHIKNGLKKGIDLISFLKRSKKESSKKYGVAALEYLLDPWDIIPDFISDDGFLDDIYVINKAIQLIQENERQGETLDKDIIKTEYNEWLILKIGGAAGPHLAKRTKDLNMLSSFQRKALFDIGRKYLYGYELTLKQHTFFETLVEDAITEGLLDYPCTDSYCKYCKKLKQYYSNKNLS